MENLKTGGEYVCVVLPIKERKCEEHAESMNKEELEDIEYLQQNLIKTLKIPPKYFELKEDDGVGTKSMEIINKNKDE